MLSQDVACNCGHVQVLFLNMESDIGIVAAFVFAHEQASKGMHQLVSIIEDGFQEDAEPPPTALTEMTLAEQARARGLYVWRWTRTAPKQTCVAPGAARLS